MNEILYLQHMEHYSILVDKALAQELRSKLTKLGLYDNSRKIKENHAKLQIPVTQVQHLENILDTDAFEIVVSEPDVAKEEKSAHSLMIELCKQVKNAFFDLCKN